MKITVVGIGYVGLSNAILFAKNHKVYAVDINSEKVNMINNKISPIKDKEIEKYLSIEHLDLTATLNTSEAYKEAEYIIIATPTNYDPGKNAFDTSSVENVIKSAVKINPRAIIVIKSTVPVGYTKSLCKKFHTDNLIFSPEFLREGYALYDNLYPSRIIVGVSPKNKKVINAAKIFANLLQQGAIKQDITTLFMGSSEAEAVKLFSNTYLAMRVAYFNEIDTYAESCDLNTKNIIDGVCSDSRIGNHYNNPSFGYGGYCLPKDTKELLAECESVPQNIIKAVVDANDTRKNHIAKRILEKAGYIKDNGYTIGIYRLTMKTDSDNFRNCAIWDIVKKLHEAGINIIIYEPFLKETNLKIEYKRVRVVNNLEMFQRESSLIIANRYNKDLDNVKNKIYTRDLYNNN